jgi:hypothetical protein
LAAAAAAVGRAGHADTVRDGVDLSATRGAAGGEAHGRPVHARPVGEAERERERDGDDLVGDDEGDDDVESKLDAVADGVSEDDVVIKGGEDVDGVPEAERVGEADGTPD